MLILRENEIPASVKGKYFSNKIKFILKEKFCFFLPKENIFILK